MSRADTDPQPAVPGPAAADAQPAAPGPGEGEPVPAASGSAADDGPAARQPWHGWEPIIRLGGVVIAILASFVSGVFELLLSTMRSGDLTAVWSGDAIGSGGGPLIGVSIVLAAGLNYGIAWFAVSTTGRNWALGPPWALWTLMMLFAAGVRTDEGDYLLGGTNWVALVMILVGSLSYAIYSYRMILRRIPR